MIYPILTDFEWMLVGIFSIILFVFAFRSDKKKSVNEWDTPEWHEKWKKIEEDREREERERLIPSKILVTEAQFDALSGTSIKIQKLLNRLCYDESFIRHVHQRDERTRVLYVGEDMYSYYKHEPLQDVLWVLDRLGHLCDHQADYGEMLKRCRIDFETIEGHCLLIVSRTMNDIDRERLYSYFDYQRTVGDPESLFFKYRHVDNTDFDLFVHYDPAMGQDDYHVCDFIGDYGEDDKLLYRNLMFRLGKTLAEILGAPMPLESEWLAKNHGGSMADADRLEKANDGYEVPLYKPSNTSYYDDDDMDDDDMDDDETDAFDDADSDYGLAETAEITYSFIGSDTPKDSFEMELPEKDADRLRKADEYGEFLDSDYISKHMASLHRKILRAIREDLETKTGDPHDGMKEVFYPPAYHGWEKAYDSHQDLLLSFDEDSVEYEVDLY